MIAAIITGPTLVDAARQIAKAGPFLEIRLDLIRDWSLDALKNLMQGKKVILTWKGGANVLPELIALNPDYIDVDRRDLHHILGRFPSERIIASHHDFEKTTLPEPLEGVIEKAALFPNSFSDVITLLKWCQKGRRVAISLGERGSFSRVLNLKFSSLWTYAPVEGETAPGQIPYSDLCRVTKDTELFALIGDPVAQSIGHTYHNARFRQQGRDSFYVKIPVAKHELSEAFHFLKESGFKGLSVTMPHKEAVIPLLDEVNAVHGAVNTVIFKEKSFGTNTDGAGALDAIEAHIKVKGKTILLYGAGGAARAFTFEAKKRGANVVIERGSSRKAEAFASEFEIEVASSPRYDILVNATPADCQVAILRGSYVLDMQVVPKWTPLLLRARKAKAHPIFGEEMFVKQAEGQKTLFH